jgi:hypothetical protein
MAILPTSNVNSPISADLMYRFYDNKAITPQIRDALQKRQDAEDAKSGSDTSKSGTDPLKPGPATRVNITDQIVRMNMANNTTKKEEPADASAATDTKKNKFRYDVLEEVKKSVAAREAEVKKDKDAQLKEISDKVSADEASKKAAADEASTKAAADEASTKAATGV